MVYTVLLMHRCRQTIGCTSWRAVLAVWYWLSGIGCLVLAVWCWLSGAGIGISIIIIIRIIVTIAIVIVIVIVVILLFYSLLQE